VREVAAFLSGALNREQALAAGRTATRQYAKRQYTWFSRQSPPDWPRLTEPLVCGSLDHALALLDSRAEG
jgi:tRNA dimethylallyltransferase